VILESELNAGARLGIIMLALSVVVGLGFGVFGIAKGTVTDMQKAVATMDVSSSHTLEPIVKKEASVIVERVFEKVVIVPAETSEGSTLPWVIGLVLVVAIITGGTVVVMRGRQTLVPELLKSKATPPKTGTRSGNFGIPSRESN
jgi:hypothetical protein